MPTPEQLAGWLAVCTDEERSDFAASALTAMDAAERCVIEDHLQRLLPVPATVEYAVVVGDISAEFDSLGEAQRWADLTESRSVQPAIMQRHVTPWLPVRTQEGEE